MCYTSNIKVIFELRIQKALWRLSHAMKTERVNRHKNTGMIYGQNKK